MQETVDTLISELDAPVRSFRLFALEQAISFGSSPELLEALRCRLKAEDDPECQLMLKHAFEIVSARISGTLRASEGFHPEEFKTLFPKLEEADRFAALNKFPTENAKSLAPFAPGLLAEESSPMIRAAIIRVLGKFWPKEALTDVAACLETDHLSTRIAALETLVHLAPELLSKNLPQLLCNPDPRLRALAVRGLAQIDFEEALQHLILLFDSPEPAQVLAALQNSVFFPFERIKPLLFKRLALESNLKMVARIGLFLEFNPDPEIPYRLWEQLESAAGEKKKVLKMILQRTCENIQKTGILDTSYQHYYEGLQAWIQKRAVNRWIQEILVHIDDPNAPLMDLETAVKLKLSEKFFRDAFSETLNWPVSERVKGIVKTWLADKPAEAAAKVPGEVPAGETPKEPVFEDLPHDQKVRLLASLGTDAPPGAPALIEHVLQGHGTPADLLATTFRTALRLNLSGFVAHAKQGLKQKDPNLITACMEYLGTFDLDGLIPYLGTFLKNENIRVISTSLRLLQKFDPLQSLSALKSLLTSRHLGHQQTAIGCMVYFEFSLVRSSLLQFLMNTRHADFIKSGLFLFKTNPEVENLYLLYRLEKHCETRDDTSQTALAKQVRLENQKFLEETGQIEKKSDPDREAEFQERLKEDNVKETRSPAPYSVQSMTAQGLLSDLTAELRVRLFGMSARETLSFGGKRLYEGAKSHPHFVLGPLLAGFALFFFLNLQPGELAPERTKAMPVLAKNLDIEGVVKENVYEGIILEGNDHQSYILLPSDGLRFPAISPGTRLKASLIPFRIEADGRIRGRCMRFEMP